MYKKIVLICAIVTLVSVFLVGCTSTQNESNLNMDSNKPPQQTGTEILIPLSDLTNSAKFYYFESEGVSIRYFAVKDTSNNVHVAVYACDV